MNWMNFDNYKAEINHRKLRELEYLDYMRTERNNCETSKRLSGNWSEKIGLPETARTDDSNVICFMDGRDKLSGKYFDSRLECAGETVSYSCIIK